MALSMRPSSSLHRTVAPSMARQVRAARSAHANRALRAVEYSAGAVVPSPCDLAKPISAGGKLGSLSNHRQANREGRTIAGRLRPYLAAVIDYGLP